MSNKSFLRPLLAATLLIGGSIALGAQIDIPYAVMQRFDALGAEMIYPLESDYRYRAPQANDYLNYDFAIQSRREGLEIRYALLPADSLDALADYPHVAVGRLLMHLASNDDDAVVTTHSLPDEEVRYDYQAEWARLFHFRPKRSFSTAEHCRLLALYREGQGLAYILLLFDRAPPQLDSRTMALRFRAPLPRPQE